MAMSTAIAQGHRILLIDRLNIQAFDWEDEPMTDRPFESLPELDFQAQVVDLAELRGWDVTQNSILSPKGCPDLFMQRRERLVAAELKSEKGRLTAEQRVWLSYLTASRGVDVYVWRPSNWNQVEEALA